MRLDELLDDGERVPRALAERLREVVLADAEHPDLHPTPWAAALVTRFGALVGGIALLSCLGMVLSAALEGAAVLLAVISSAVGLAMYRAAPRALRDLVQQLALLLHWTGAMLWMYGLFSFDLDERVIAALWLLWELATLLLWPDFAQRGMSAVGAMLAGIVVIGGIDDPGDLLQVLGLLPAIGAVALWGAQPALARQGYTELVEPVAASWTMLGVLCALPPTLLGVAGGAPASAVAVAVLLGVVGWFAAREERASLRPALAALVVALLPATWLVPGVGVSAALTLLLVERGRPALAALCTTALSLNAAYLYYDLHLPFSTKAGAMAATGALLWAASLLVPAEEAR